MFLVSIEKREQLYFTFSSSHVSAFSAGGHLSHLCLSLCVRLQDLLPWVSGEHGFIVFALGTMVSEMPEEIMSVFIEAFRQIPQKVPGSFNTHAHNISLAILKICHSI